MIKKKATKRRGGKPDKVDTKKKGGIFRNPPRFVQRNAVGPAQVWWMMRERQIDEEIAMWPGGNNSVTNCDLTEHDKS